MSCPPVIEQVVWATLPYVDPNWDQKKGRGLTWRCQVDIWGTMVNERVTEGATYSSTGFRGGFVGEEKVASEDELSWDPRLRRAIYVTLAERPQVTWTYKWSLGSNCVEVLILGLEDPDFDLEEWTEELRALL